MKLKPAVSFSIAATLLCASCASTPSAPKLQDPESSPAGEGLSHPDNDPAVVALIVPVKECEWRSGKPSMSCDAFKAFNASIRDMADETLVRALGDADAKARYLASYALFNGAKKYTTDAALARLVIEAAEAERDAVVGYQLGLAAGKIRVEELGESEAVVELAQMHPVDELRAGVAYVLLKHNPSPALFGQMYGMAMGDPNDSVRQKASHGLFLGVPDENVSEACDLWVKTSSSEVSEDFALQAMVHTASLRRGQGCRLYYGDLLESMAAHSREKVLTSSMFTRALKALLDSQDLAPTQIGQVIEIAEATVRRVEHSESVRASVLRLLGERSTSGIEFAKEFVDDPASRVKGTAAKIVSGEIGPK